MIHKCQGSVKVISREIGMYSHERERSVTCKCTVSMNEIIYLPYILKGIMLINFTVDVLPGDIAGLGPGLGCLRFCEFPPGWWAATVSTYCPSRMVEHPKSKSTQPSSATCCVTMYVAEEEERPRPQQRPRPLKLRRNTTRNS